MAGLAVAATGGAVVSAGAFTSEVSAGADMRVVVVSDLRLEPARDDEGREENEYVIDDGEIAIVIDKLNKHAFTEFGDLVQIRNEGNVGYDKLTFEFLPSDDTDADVTEAMKIVYEGELTEKNDDDTFTIRPENGLQPGGDPVPFGVAVDLLPDDSERSDFPDSAAEFELEIIAERLE